jgi:hypothetical protein
MAERLMPPLSTGLEVAAASEAPRQAAPGAGAQILRSWPPSCSSTRRGTTLLWLLGLKSSYTMGGYIHILFGLAIAALVLRIIQDRRMAL